jgi:hypothetical protein
MGEFREVHYIAMALVAVAAWTVSATRRSHLAFASYAAWMFAMDLVRIGLAAKRRGLVHPLTGVARAAFHAEQAIVVSWSLFFLACCMHYFAKRGALVPIALWLVVSLALIVAYPSGARAFSVLYTTRIYYVVTALSWAVILYGVVSRTARVELAHVMILIYAAVDVVVIAVPLANAEMSNWPIVRAANTLGAVGMLVAHAAVLLRDRLASRRVAAGSA